MKQLFLIGAGLAMIIGAAGAASAMDEDGAWQALGRSRVSGPNDTISVRGYDQFRDIRICALNGPVSVRKLNIRFYSGQVQEIERPMVLATNSCTRAIDLAGDKRNIERIKVSYSSPTSSTTTQVSAQGR